MILLHLLSGNQGKGVRGVSSRVRLPAILLLPILRPGVAVLWRQRRRNHPVWRQRPRLQQAQIRVVLDQGRQGLGRLPGRWVTGREQGHRQGGENPAGRRQRRGAQEGGPPVRQQDLRPLPASLFHVHLASSFRCSCVYGRSVLRRMLPCVLEPHDIPFLIVMSELHIHAHLLYHLRFE